MIGAILLKLMAGSGMNEMNRRDIPKLLSHWADDAVFIYPGNMSVSGRMEGKKAIEEFFQKFMDQFPEFHSTIKNTYVKNIFALGPSNIVAMECESVFTNRNGEVFENSVVSIAEVRWGKVVSMQDYYFDVDKLQRAWGE